MNTVPAGLIVTRWPDDVLLAVTVTVTVAPALIVPLDGLRCTVPSPLDTLLDHVTGPPVAVREIVAPPGGTASAPPDGETASVPGTAVALDVGLPVALALVVADGLIVAADLVARLAAVCVLCGVVVAETVEVGVAELVGELPGEAPNGAAAEGPVGDVGPARSPAAGFACPELPVSATRPRR